MPVKIRNEGQYELFETTHQHKMLVLNDEQWYAAVKGQLGDILVRSDSDHQKDHTIQKGQFYVVDFQDDPKFKDMPHLFLEKEGRYQELMIPNGLPTDQDVQKNVVWTDDTIPKEDLDAYLEDPAPAGPGEERMARPGGGSMANVTHHLQGIDLPAKQDELIRYAKKNDAPAAVIQQLEKLDEGPFHTMADVMAALGEGHAVERLPIDNYDELTVDEVTDRLDNLNQDELEQIRDYEAQHKERKTVLEAVDERLQTMPGGKNFPIDEYNELTADEVTDRLDDMNEEELEQIRRYEEQHRNRKTVLEAVDRQQ
jgi:hypothetical protein